VRQDHQWSIHLVEPAVVRGDDQIEFRQRRLVPRNQAHAELGQEFRQPGKKRIGRLDGEDDLHPEIVRENRQQVEQSGHGNGVVDDDEDALGVSHRGPPLRPGADGHVAGKLSGHRFPSL
jgi:hypothetical protein